MRPRRLSRALVRYEYGPPPMIETALPELRPARKHRWPHIPIIQAKRMNDHYRKAYRRSGRATVHAINVGTDLIVAEHTMRLPFVHALFSPPRPELAN